MLFLYRLNTRRRCRRLFPLKIARKDQLKKVASPPPPPPPRGCIWRDVIPTVTDISTPSSKYPPITPVENISCPVLLVVGTGDLNVNPEFSAELIFNRLKTRGKEHLCSILRYPEAGHLIEPPYTPHCYYCFSGITAKWSGDKYLVWGGEMNAHAKAQEDAWTKILSFLRKNLQYSSSL